MKLRWLGLLLAAALLAGVCTGIAEEADCWAGFFDYYYHATDRCALAGTVAPMPLAEAERQGKYPCPVCVEDGTKYSGVKATIRGGTIVMRVPDSWIQSKLEDAEGDGTLDLSPFTPEADALQNLARLVHGDAYCELLAGYAASGSGSSTAALPDVLPANGELLMSRRHLGAAWYLVLRPDADGRRTADRKKALDLSLRCLSATLALEGFDARNPYLSLGEPGVWSDDSYRLKLSKSKNKTRHDQIYDSGLSLAVYRDMDANICVIHEPGATDASGVRLLLDGVGPGIRLEGYVEGDEAIYCCVLTDAELDALQRFAQPALVREQPDALSLGDALESLAAPQSAALAPNGTRFAAEPAEYPPQADAVGLVLTRPGGGGAYYHITGPFERLEGGAWVALEGSLSVNDAPRGYVFDRQVCAVPLDGAGELKPGAYRLLVDADYEGDTPVRTYVEFRVSADAPALPLPEDATREAPPALAAHTPAHFAADYNSCLDTTRRAVNGARTLLLAGDTVFELNGAYMDDWDWVPTRYWLSRYPAGHPEQAVPLGDPIDLSDLTFFDTGSDLLLWSFTGGFYRLGYDGAALTPMDWPLPGDPLEQTVLDVLPVGDALYLAAEDGLWRMPLAGGPAERIYAASDALRNSASGGGQMIFADGRLYLVDGGIVEFDPAARATRRLTGACDGESGDCGFGYLVLSDGCLYCWDAGAEATVAIPLSGGAPIPVSGTRFYFSQADAGTVLALSGKNDTGIFGGYDSAAFYDLLPGQVPALRPDDCPVRPILEHDFCLGDWLYHTEADGRETVLAR